MCMVTIEYYNERAFFYYLKWRYIAINSEIEHEMIIRLVRSLWTFMNSVLLRIIILNKSLLPLSITISFYLRTQVDHEWTSNSLR